MASASNRAERELGVPAITAEAGAAAAAAAAAATKAPPPRTAPAAWRRPSQAAAGGKAPGAAPAGVAAGSAMSAALAEANRSIPSGDQSVRLLAPAEGAADRRGARRRGGCRQRHRSRPLPARRPSGVDQEASRRSASTSISRPQPRAHVIKAVAEAANGKPLAEDQPLLNAGPHRFGVRLIEPQAGRHYTASALRAEAKVEVPRRREAGSGRVLPRRHAGGLPGTNPPGRRSS